MLLAILSLKFLALVATAGGGRVVLDDSKPPLYGYAYGGTTTGGVEKRSGETFVAFHGDDGDWSGWTVGFDTLGLKGQRNKGGIVFQARGGKGGEKVLLGLLDAGSGGKDRNVQTQVDLPAYGTLTKEWQTFAIPFHDFPNKGRWWNAKARTEMEADFDWSHVVQFRLSGYRGANAKFLGPDGKYLVEFRNLEVRDSVAYFDRDAWWKAFRSDAPERNIFPAGDSIFRNSLLLQHDRGGSLSGTWTDIPGHGKTLELGYQFQNWTSASFTPRALEADWSRHNALALDLYTPRAVSALRIGVVDSGDEAWLAMIHASKGWSRVVVPFRDFERDPWWQPDDVVPNRRMDLGRVHSFSVSPMDAGLAGIVRIGRIALVNEQSTENHGSDSRPALLYDHLGYLPGSGKRFLVSGMTKQTSWALLDSNRRAVRQGDLTPLGVWSASGDTLAVGDFSGWTRPGRYRLAVGDSMTSEFVLSDTVYRGLSRSAVRAFSIQRCGIAMDSAWVGIWARRAGHPDTALPVEEVPGVRGKRDVHGGWYDAGDYGKYVVSGGIALWHLLSLQETWPGAFPDGSLSIPESGNGVGDLLDESRWELSWFARMQDRDGGVFFKVGPKSWDGSVLPEQSTQPRFVFGKSTSSTLYASAVFAQASRVWSKADPAFARDCRARAVRAWTWACRNPANPTPENGGGTGIYPEGPLDEARFWAAAELWLATGAKTYREDLSRLAPRVPFKSHAWWQDVGNLGWLSIARLGGKDVLAGTAREKIRMQADSILARMDASAGRVPDESFWWGSNDVELGCAVTLANAYMLDSKPEWRDAALEVLDYVLGRNVLGSSFVTGTGPGSPQHPHHRLFRAEGLPPFPGFLVGGPNSGHEDDVSKDVDGVRWNGEPPARSWRDDDRSYATNEIAVNWNASLAWVACWADHLERP
ncbi:MAG TPA: glycoside hydrolase family 9 protein [Fibrobacteria bacterium]|nr:glycoside hydrolase family 9 protein [Fibrobacteria bacterium]